MSETRRVTRRAGVVAASTLASRVLGMARDMVIAALFQSAATDLFFIAFTIPNSLRRLVGEGALTVSFVPVMTETLEKQGREAARRFVAAMMGVTLVGLTLLTIVGTIGSPWLVWLYGSGLARFPGQIELAGDLATIMFCYIWFAGLTALSMGILNSVGRFFAPAFAPVLLNLALIGCGLLLAQPLRAAGMPAIASLAIGAVLGGLLQLALQLPSLRREGMLPRPRVDWKHPGVRQVLLLMVPALFGVGVYQLNILLSRTFASLLPVGSVTYLYYAFRLVELPQGLFIYALAAAMLPSLSGYVAREDMPGLKGAYRFALRQTLFVSLPAAVGLGVLALPVVVVLFQRGQFDHTSAVATAWALLYQAPGIVLVAGVRQTVPVFFSLKDTRTPVLASTANLIVFAGLSLLLMGPMLHAGISLAISLAAGAQLVFLLVALRKKLGPLGLTKLVPGLVKSSLASVGCGAAAWGIGQFGHWQRGGNDLVNILIVVAAISAGGLAYGVLSLILRSREARELLDAVRRRGRGPKKDG